MTLLSKGQIVFEEAIFYLHLHPPTGRQAPFSEGFTLGFIWPVRLGVRTPGFHPGNRGSIPLRATTKTLTLSDRVGVFY